MNIGEAVKTLQIKYPSASISRIRFLEKEGLINIKRSSGGTRKFTNKDIEKISRVRKIEKNLNMSDNRNIYLDNLKKEMETQTGLTIKVKGSTNKGKVEINGKIYNEYTIRNDIIKTIVVSGEVLKKYENRLWIFNKPVGYVSSNKEQKNQKSLCMKHIYLEK